MPKKQPRTPEARADLIMSIVFEMLSLARDSHNKTFSIRYPDGGCKSIYTRLVALTGERGKWDALERAGLMLIEENGRPQAVKAATEMKKEPVRWESKAINASLSV
jgi:hypothetical protein